MAIGDHAAALRRKRLQLVRTDDYGNTFTDALEQEAGWEARVTVATGDQGVMCLLLAMVSR